MSRAPGSLRLIRSTSDPSPAGTVAGTETPGPGLRPLPTTGPDGGRRAHPATLAGPREAVRTQLDVANEVTGFVADLLDAPAGVVGEVTAGVLEAALLVVQSARDARPHLRRPTLVLAETAHPAYLVAATTLGVVPIVVPVDHEGRAPVGAMSAAIHDETVLVVASAPSYALGQVDPVAWLGAAAVVHEVPLHVDASSGGWSLAYAGRAGCVGTSWGFAVPGVTSVAVDVGPDDGGPVGTVVVLNREPPFGAGPSERHGRLDDLSAWRPAARALADVAETLREIGHDGCSDLALAGRAALEHLVHGLADVRGVHVVGHPEGTTVTLRTDTTCDVFTLADEIGARGWACEPVLSHGGWPAVLRLRVTAAVLPVVDDLVDAIADSVLVARGAGRGELHPPLQRMLDVLRPYDVGRHAARRVVEAAGFLDTDDRTASMRRLLDAARPGVREALVMARRDLLLQPTRPVAAGATTTAVE